MTILFTPLLAGGGQAQSSTGVSGSAASTQALNASAITGTVTAPGAVTGTVASTAATSASSITAAIAITGSVTGVQGINVSALVVVNGVTYPTTSMYCLTGGKRNYTRKGDTRNYTRSTAARNYTIATQ